MQKEWNARQERIRCGARKQSDEDMHKVRVNEKMKRGKATRIQFKIALQLKEHVRHATWTRVNQTR